MLSFPSLGRPLSWTALYLVSLLSFFVLTFSLSAQAQSGYPGGGYGGGGYPGGGYPGGGGGYGGATYSGGTVTLTSTGSPNPLPIDYTYNNDGSWGGGYYASGHSDSNGANIVSGKATCSGKITATFTWNNGGDPNNTPPKCIVITEKCTTGWSGSASNGATVTGGCTNPLGGSSVPNVPGPGAEWDYTRYTVQNNPPATLTVSCSPEAHADSAGSATPSSNAVGGSNVSYSVSVSPVTIGLQGATTDPNDKSLNALTGQQITATLSAPYTVSGYQWSTTGATGYNPFWTWDPTWPNSQNPSQFVPLSNTEITSDSFSFYDAHDGDGITVSCTATVNPPTGPPLTVNAISKSIKYHKPSVSWTVNKPFIADQKFGYFATLPLGPYWATELWGPITITEPPLFTNGNSANSVGFGVIVQVATPNRLFSRNPTNGKPGTYSKVSVINPDGTTGSQTSPTGLDGPFPYPYGWIKNADGSFTRNYGNYGWLAYNNGYSGDTPTATFATKDLDGGGEDWFTSSTSDAFTTWVMYRPASVGNQGTIYVPLQSLMWNWGAKAATDNGSFSGNWSMTPNSPPFSSGTPANTETYPSWSLSIAGPTVVGP